MLPNKFDQYFRDKLLDHSTKPSAGTWKLIHAALLRHKAFHFWKWWVAGPAVVAVAVTGYVIIAQISKPVKLQNTLNNSSKSATSNSSSTPAAGARATPNTSNTAATNTSNTAATDITTSFTNGTVHKPLTITSPKAQLTANGGLTASTRLTASPRSNNGGAYIRHPTNGHTPTGNHNPQGRNSRSQPGYLASATSATEPTTSATEPSTSATEFATGSATKPATAGAAVNPSRPTGAALQIVHPSIRLAVTAQTPNAKSSKKLVVPAVPYHHTSSWRIDGFVIPAYFFSNEFGFSYGAGATATYVFKKHFTITAGLQFLKVDVKANKKVDSLNGFYPGIFNNVQAPLLIGYTTGNQRISLTVNAGAIFSLYADAKGLLKYYGWPNHNGVTSYLGLNFATHVSDRLSIFAEPYIKCWYPQKFQALPPQLFSTGISVGLRYDLK